MIGTISAAKLLFFIFFFKLFITIRADFHSIIIYLNRTQYFMLATQIELLEN